LCEGISNCYEKLVKELLVNILDDYDDPKSPEFRKVFVRGKCAEFYPAMINRVRGRSEEKEAELEISDNELAKVITAN
jgi:hypothetical protein